MWNIVDKIFEVFEKVCVVEVIELFLLVMLKCFKEVEVFCE